MMIHLEGAVSTFWNHDPTRLSAKHRLPTRGRPSTYFGSLEKELWLAS